MKRIAIICVVLMCVTLQNSFAAPVLSVPLGTGYLDVDYFAGPANATNTAYFVVDFGANGGATHAFGYRWDGSQTPADALLGLNGITNAGPLVVNATDFGGTAGLFISSISDPPDSAAPTGNDFWDYWLGTYGTGSVNWTEAADYGISGTDLNGVVHYMQNGDFFGFRVDTFNTDTFQTDGGPPLAPVATVPEPNAIVLMLSGLACGLWMMRFNRRHDG